MDGDNLIKNQRIILTKSDEADKIWSKVKEKVATMSGKVVWNCQIIALEGQIVEIRYRPSEIEECIRA